MEIKKNESIHSLEPEELEAVSGGWKIENGKLIPSAGCRCGSAPEDMVYTSVSIHESGERTVCRFICSKCGRPLNALYNLDRFDEFSALLSH